MSTLLERINLLAQTASLTDQLLDQLDTELTKQYNAARNLDYTDHDSIIFVGRLMKNVIIDYLQKFNATLANHHKKLKRTTVAFAKMSSGVGEYDEENNQITFKLTYLSKLAKLASERMDAVQGEVSGKVMSINLHDSPAFVEIVKKLTSLYVHEITHAIQFAKAAVDDTYRSYTEPNKAAFYAKLDQGILDLDYYASPEEIDAYAHGRAMELIQMSSAPPDSQEMLDHVTAQLKLLSSAGTSYEKFRNSDKRINTRVVNRYLKKVYLELDDYRQHLQAKLEQ